MTGVRRWSRAVAWGALSLLLAAQAGMPDPAQMHGKALPASDLPNGTVTVRVVRESVVNNLPGQTVRVTVGSVTRTATTDDQGRATFGDLPAGSTATAESTVEGEVLTSDPFTVPSTGGLRMILVAGLGQAAAARAAEEKAALAAPPVKGSVVLGGSSRILMEFQDDTLQVFYIFDILNNAQSRVDIGGPLVIDLPSGAAGAASLEGSTQQASINGARVTVTGPFAPGATSLQIGYSLPNVGASYEFRQTLPVALEAVTVALQRVGAVTMASSQFQRSGDVRSESGSTFLVGSGPALPVGTTLAVDLTGIPAHSPVPGYVAVGLAGLVVAVGIWLSMAGGPNEADNRQRLLARRDTLLGDLAHLEQRRRAGNESAKDVARRTRVVAELEQIYGELDDAGVNPQGGREGVPA